MEITDKNLLSFQDWILERGRSKGTADFYASCLRSCAADKKRLTKRLLEGGLAPNTLRGNLAALRAWAVYTKDPDLTFKLQDIRLPPARRVRVKMPLEVAVWKKMVRHLQTCDIGCSETSEAMRQVLLVMAVRGLRSGDVLRMERKEVVRALDTGKLVYEGKGRKRIEISAVPIKAQLEVLAKIKNWERVRDLISRSKNPKVASVKVWRAARRTASKVGVFEMNPHRYRHTFATNYLKQLQGDPNAIVKLQKYMGWESMTTAARYVDQVSQDELDTIGAGLVSGLLDP